MQRDRGKSGRRHQGRSFNFFKAERESKLKHYKFHQEFSALLIRFKDECHQWANQRSNELECVCFWRTPLGELEVDFVSRIITRSMASASLSRETEDNHVLPTPVSPIRGLPPKNPGVNLPPPSSDDWEEVPLPPPPPGTNRPKTRSRR